MFIPNFASGERKEIADPQMSGLDLPNKFIHQIMIDNHSVASIHVYIKNSLPISQDLLSNNTSVAHILLGLMSTA